MPKVPIQFGAYLLQQENHEIVVIISTEKQHRKKVCDLLFETGKTLFDQDIEQIVGKYSYLFTDSQLLIDGCSSNPGWEKAHRLANELLV